MIPTVWTGEAQHVRLVSSKMSGFGYGAPRRSPGVTTVSERTRGVISKQ
jgi:hypothetical protein